jgi:hypothetical protein
MHATHQESITLRLAGGRWEAAASSLWQFALLISASTFLSADSNGNSSFVCPRSQVDSSVLIPCTRSLPIELSGDG